MITHLVLLKPRPDLTAADRSAFVAAFGRAIREIPSVRSVRIGRRVTHGAGYEQLMPDTGEFMAALDFDDLDGLHMYLWHPAHAEVGMLFGRFLSSSLVYDFDCGDMEMLVRWI